MCYDYNIVIDLEFTPTPKNVRRRGLAREIIEIGAVKVDARGREVSTFQCYVRPQYAEDVSYEVQDLTGIHRCDIRDAACLEVAVRQLAAWIGDAKVRIVAWSGSDKAQIERELVFKRAALPGQFACWLDLQKVYPRVMGVGNGRLMALRVAADWQGIVLDAGSSHRALYDARVTAELLRQLLTGAYHEQKETLESVIVKPENQKTFSASLGSRCSELGELLAKMQVQGAMSAA